MNEIQHDLWDEIFEHYEFKTIHRCVLLSLIKKVENLKFDLLKIKSVFNNKNVINLQAAIEQKKPKEGTSEKVQSIGERIMAIQQNTENDVMPEKNSFFKFYYKLIKEVQNFKIINLTKQEITDSIPSKVDDEKSEQIKDIKYLQFIEVMYQHEIRRVIGQLIDLRKRYFAIRNMSGKEDYKVRFATKEKYFISRYYLIDKFLTFEYGVLEMKFKREQVSTNLKAVGVKMTNISSKIDNEKSRLMRDNIYLSFIQQTHQIEIKRIIDQLNMYCDTYNMPDEDVNINAHKDFIMQKIKKIKEALDLREEVMDFNLQIEQKNVETIDSETTTISSKIESVKSMLKKNNKYLRYIAMEHQREINGVYEKLKSYCDQCNVAIQACKLPNGQVDCNKETNVSSKINIKSELWNNNETLRINTVELREKFIEIYDQLEIYRSRYDKPNENMVVTHTKPYNPTQTHDDENELMKDNEYLAFVAMMHLEKIKEISVFFKMECNRFNDRIEELTNSYTFRNQLTFSAHTIFFLQGEISLLKDELLIMKTF